MTKATTLKTPLSRESGIELYRIISMLFIIAHHYVINSGLRDILFANPIAPKSLFLLVFSGFGKIGINCFVLISGYFMCKSRITPKKFAKLLFELVFYRLAINCIFWITGYAPFTLNALIDAVIPFTSVARNFSGTYLIFFLSIPFLNLLVQNMTEKQHLLLIGLLAFTYIFFASVPYFEVTMNYFSWYIVLFFIASYIRLYPKDIFRRKKLWGIATLVCMILCILSIVAGAFVYKRTGVNIIYFFVTDCNVFLAVLTGLCSFLFFKNLNMKPNRFINTVSATTFGVLLIHANSDTMRRWLWGDILNNVGMYDSSYVCVHAIVSVLAIFAVCSCLDLLRICLIEKPFFKFWDKHWDKVLTKYQALEAKLLHKLNISQ